MCMFKVDSRSPPPSFESPPHDKAIINGTHTPKAQQWGQQDFGMRVGAPLPGLRIES